MSRILFLICLASFAITSCKKNDTKIVESSSIIGTWELRQVRGNLPPQNFAPGNGNTIVFTDKTYKNYSNGQLVRSGTYDLVADPTASQNTCLVIENGQYTQRIIQDGNTNLPKMFIQISNNQLTFLSGCFALDAGSGTDYARIGN
jgi:hypothetical protein